MNETCEISVNLDAVRNTIKSLLKYAHYRIKDLPDDIGDKFRQFVTVIATYHNSDVYDEIFTIIDAETRQLLAVTPGTLGAYFRGCLIPVTFPDNPSCSELCASAFQPPNNSEGWHSCEYLVVAAEYSHDTGFVFDVIRQGNNPGYVIVKFNTIEKFPGFSQPEKEALKKTGLKICKLLTVNKNGDVYRDLLDNFVAVERLPSRASHIDTSEGISWGLLVILAIIVISVLIYIFGSL